MPWLTVIVECDGDEALRERVLKQLRGPGAGFTQAAKSAEPRLIEIPVPVDTWEVPVPADTREEAARRVEDALAPGRHADEQDRSRVTVHRD